MLLLVLIPILGSHINEKNQKKKRKEKTQKYQKCWKIIKNISFRRVYHNIHMYKQA
jgi:cytochrome c biogenesis protein ResB